MIVSRRDTLAGAAAIGVAAIVPVAGPRVGLRRPTLEPLGHVRVRLTDAGCTAHLRSFFDRYLEIVPEAPQAARQASALMNIYRDLLEGRELAAEDIESLDPGKLKQLLDLPEEPHPAAVKYGYDQAVCRIVDEAVAEIVHDGWVMARSPAAQRALEARTILDRADQLQRAGDIDQAVALCDQALDLVGKGGQQGARAVVNKCFWLDKTSRHAESVAIFDEIWFGHDEIEEG